MNYGNCIQSSFFKFRVVYRYIDIALISNIFYCHAIRVKYLNIFTYYYNMMPDPDKPNKIFIC